MRWLRLYDSVLDDPKVQRLAPELFKAWVNLLCVACRKDGAIPTNDLGFMLRTDDATAERWVAELEAAGLIDRAQDGSRRPHDWDEYQFVSDTSTDRVRAFRARKKAGPNGPEPDPSGGPEKPKQARNVSGETECIAPESESESESEQSQSVRAARETTDRLDIRLLEKVVALFGRDTAKLGRMMAGASTARVGAAAYLKGVIEREAKPAAVTSPSAPVAAVWVRFGSPAWLAWDGINPQAALESKHHPGELGRYRQSEYPPERARA